MKLTINVSAGSVKQATFGLDKFIKNAMMMFNLNGGDAIVAKDIVVKNCETETVEEMLF